MLYVARVFECQCPLILSEGVPYCIYGSCGPCTRCGQQTHPMAFEVLDEHPDPEVQAEPMGLVCRQCKDLLFAGEAFGGVEHREGLRVH